MRPAGEATVPVDLTLAEVGVWLARSRNGQLPVIDATGAYHGVITARAVADVLAVPGHDTDPVASVVEYPTVITATEALEQALDALAAADGPVPVLDPKRAELVGWLTHQQVLRTLQPSPMRTPRPRPHNAALLPISENIHA
jgi:CIC family chloride channel protein